MTLAVLRGLSVWRTREAESAAALLGQWRCRPVNRYAPDPLDRHLAAAQASTYQGLGYVRAGRPWTAPVEAPATEEPQQGEGGPPMSAAARLMYELKKAKEEARRVEERLVRLRR